VLGVWKKYAKDLRGGALPCNHYLAEEEPEMTARRLLRFFTPFR
jgi:haloacetate dehalogenase